MAAQVPCSCCELAMVSSRSRTGTCAQCTKESEYGDLCEREVREGRVLRADENGRPLRPGQRARVTRNGRWMFS